MEKIKVFIASSSEMKEERLELVYLLVIEMNDELESKGYELEPEKWEYMDPSMKGCRKEDEYLERLRECEICLSLFWKTLGQYTDEELKVALNEQRNGQFPKLVHVFFRETTDQSADLHTFMNEYTSKRSDICDAYANIPMLRRQVRDVINNYLSGRQTTKV